MSNRKRPFLILIAFLAFVAYIYGFWIEPYALEVARYRLDAPISAPLKIAHLSDLHTRGIGKLESKMLAKLDEEKPDVIVVTGDTISGGVKSYTQAGELIGRLHAPLGVWVVRGNWELWNPISDEREFYQKAGATLLIDEAVKIRNDVWLVGLNDWSARSPNSMKAFDGIPGNAFKVALFHSPATFDMVSPVCDLALAGHTHGGQVRLPFVGPLWLPRGCGSYVEGWYTRDESRMYVSRGLGTSVMGVRFLCRPELVLIELGSRSRG